MKNKKLNLTLVVTGVLMLIMAGCNPGPTSKRNCAKLIRQELKERSIAGAAPVRIKDGKVTLPPIFNLPYYKITKLNDIKVLKFGPVPCKEELKNGNISGILDEMPIHCKYSIITEFTTSHSEMKGYTAILAEVSIAQALPINSYGKMFKKPILVHKEYFNQKTRIWFLGHTIKAENKDEKDFYSIDVACFEDLDYFDKLIEELH